MARLQAPVLPVCFQSTGKTKQPSRCLALVTALFFASGAAGLIYQVVWTRTLGLVFGATTFATATVLTIFMAGLALGSWLAGRTSDRSGRPLAYYALAELVIGLWALLTPFLFAWATPLYRQIWSCTHADLIELSLWRFLVAAAILLVPTTCMGTTLPFLARFAVTGLEHVGKSTGLLYAANTAGAVVGALAAGFFLLPTLGTASTTYAAVVLNLVLAAWACFLDHKASRESRSNIMPPPAMATETKPRTSEIGRIAIIAFAISGAIAMIYEVAWTRSLAMIIGSSTYAFTIMLVAFLSGLFAGSLVLARLVDRARQPLLWFASLQFLICAATLAGALFFNYLPYLNLVINASLPGDANFAMAVRFLLSGLVLVPITFCLGAIFPVVIKSATGGLDSVGRTTGDVYAANTIGAIAGSFLAGFVLIPLVGVEKTLLLALAANLALGTVLLALAGKQRLYVWTALAATLACLSGIGSGSHIWDPLVLLNCQSARRALMSDRVVPKSMADWLANLQKQQTVAYFKDGACSNVGITKFCRAGITAMVTNGHVDASDDIDMPVQALVSAIPLVLKPEAADLAVIGWGSGVTVGTATQFPVRTIDAIELEPAVIEASRFFHHVNNKPELDPRVHISFNDGRNYLSVTDRLYDLIVSEPSNPWQSGVCNLFTREYFAIAKSRLAKGGIFSLWVQTAEVAPGDLCGVLAAVKATFPHTTGFCPRPGNLIVLASTDKLTISYARLKAAFADKRIAGELGRVGVPSPAALLAHLTIASDGLDNLVTSTFVNSDDCNHLEFDVGRSYEQNVFVSQNKALVSALYGQPWQQVDWSGADPGEQARVETAVAASLVQDGRKAEALGWLEAAARSAPAQSRLRLQAAAAMATGQEKQALRLIDRAGPVDAELALSRAILLVRTGKIAAGRQAFQNIMASSETRPEMADMARFQLASTYWQQLQKNNLAAAGTVWSLIGVLWQSRAFSQEHPNLLLLAHKSALCLGKKEEAASAAACYQKLTGHSLPCLAQNQRQIR